MFFICPRGTAQYGDPEDDSKPWSKKWKLEETEDFLFASGNMKYWLIVSREELIGVDGEKYYDGVITVTATSESETPYKTKGTGTIVVRIPLFLCEWGIISLST